jgi:paraquat-inducible protein B
MKKYNAPRVKESRGVQILTTIWLVPFLALIIALWLGYQYYSKIGSLIWIRFESNAGLIENQSPIKIRDVSIGLVKKISLTEDGQGVIIEARMNREVSDYLNEKAKFWIVHPDVGSHGISGLDTIVSGSYIELKGKKEKETTHHYIGLEKPPIDDDAKGKYFVLSAPQSYNISEGSKIYYRMLEVGRVERVGISPDGTHINFTIFVAQDYVPYINKKSKFYTRSAFNVDLSSSDFDVNIAPITQLVHGGISIYTPINSLVDKNKLTGNEIFTLYKNSADMKAKKLGGDNDYLVYILNFHEPMTKLYINAPIKFKGFQVGYITNIEDNYNQKQKRVNSRVYALIQADAFGKESIDSLVKEGLKAKLKESIPFVGNHYVELVFDKRHKAKIMKMGGYNIFPTIKNVSKRNIMDNLDDLVAKLQNLPIENLLNSYTKLAKENRKSIKALIDNLNRAVKNLNSTIKNLDSFTSQKDFVRLPRSLNQSLKEVDKTLRDLQRLSEDYGADSKFADQLSITLRAVSEASESFDKTNRMLERNANALVVGDD